MVCRALARPTTRRLTKETVIIVEQQPELIEPTIEEDVPAAQAKAPALSPNEVLFLFLACTLVGFIGVLIGFTPLVILAMAGPLVVALLA